jgi:hypothetical protein
MLRTLSLTQVIHPSHGRVAPQATFARLREPGSTSPLPASPVLICVCDRVPVSHVRNESAGADLSLWEPGHPGADLLPPEIGVEEICPR